MTTEENRWAGLRDQAESYLPKDFARQVVHKAQGHKIPDRREYVLIGFTAAICLISVAVANWYLGNNIQQRNLAQWSVVESQIKALQRSI